MKRIEEYWIPEIRDVKEFEIIANIENKEIMKLEEAYDTLYNDRFLNTATVRGISRREKIMRITPFPDDTLEERRFRVRARRDNRPPYTYKYLLNLLSQLCGENEYTITRDLNKYKITIEIELTAKKMFDEVVKVTRELISANLIVIVKVRYNQHSTLAKFTHAQLAAYTHQQLREDVIN